MTGGPRPPVPAAAAAAGFEPHALGLARRWRRMRKNELARHVGVTAAAVSQYELGQARPSAAVLARLALALAMPVEFFASGFPAPTTPGHALVLAQWGYPEPGDLGPREHSSLLGRAVRLLHHQQVTVDSLAAQAGLPPALTQTVIDAASDRTPELGLAAEPAGVVGHGAHP